MFVLYKATFENGKFYIGITSNFKNRIRQHKSKAKTGSTAHFYNAIRKYGFDTIVWTIISYHETREELLQAEIDTIEKLKPEYNMSSGGEFTIMTEEVKEKISNAKAGRRQSDKTKAKIRQTHLLKNDKKMDDIISYKDKHRQLYNEGRLRSTTLDKLIQLKSIYIPGMSQKELSKNSNISLSVITKLDWLWLEDLDEYKERVNVILNTEIEKNRLLEEQKIPCEVWCKGKKLPEEVKQKVRLSKMGQDNDNLDLLEGHVKYNQQFLDRFENGQLQKSTLDKLILLKSIYKEGMSLEELKVLSGISMGSIVSYEWKWLELDNYIQKTRKTKSTWLGESKRRKRTIENFWILNKVDTGDLNGKELGKITSINDDKIYSYKGGWKDIIEEEGF